MGNIKKSELTKTQLIQKLEKLSGRKADSKTYARLRDDLKREVDFLERKKHKREDYKRKLKEKANE